MQKFFSKINFHYLFFAILSFNYLVPLIFFNSITLFYHDALDSEIVYNKIIGKIIFNGKQELGIFLNNEIKIDFLRRVFNPLILFYSAFSTEIAYWITDIIVKTISYFSFFIFAKKNINNKFYCSLISALYAVVNLPTHIGLGFAIMPYLLYLISFKKNLIFKNFFIVFFAGLCTDIVTIIYSFPIIILLAYIFNRFTNKTFLIKTAKVIFIFLIAIIFSNFNLILLFLSDFEIHRTEFVAKYYPHTEFYKYFFLNFFELPSGFSNWTFFNNLPILIFLPFVYLSCFFYFSDKKIKILLFIIIIVHFIVASLGIELIDQLKNYLVGSLNLNYIKNILPLVYCILSLIIISQRELFIKKILIFSIFTSLVVSQLNSSAIPFYKKYVLDEKNYRNIYTFKGYYLYNDYKDIKDIVNNDRTLSIGLDPMIAVMNNIGVIDGYHNIYPLDYKKKFYHVIKNELKKNKKLENYYKSWGSRVYAFINDEKNIELDFKTAKDLGAKFVISKFKIQNNNLQIIFTSRENKINVYKII